MRTREGARPPASKWAAMTTVCLRPGVVLVLAASSVCWFFAGAGLAARADAQATRTWVSGIGDDVNPCSRTVPCKTLAGSISKTAVGGEINALDPGGFGTVTIAKPLTIDLSSPTRGGILNTLTQGVLVNATGADDVVLRGLDINGTGPIAGSCASSGTNGIRVLGARTVTIADSTISGQNAGVLITPGAADVKVILNRVEISNTCANGIVAAPTNGRKVDITVRDSTITNTGTAISAADGVHVWLTGSTIFGNALGLETIGTGIIDSFADNQIMGNALDGTPTNTLIDRAGPVGPAGPQGPMGASIVGPQGTAGPRGTPALKLLLALPKNSVSVRSGQGLALSYVATGVAATTLQIRKGRQTVATIKARARTGRNTINWNGKAAGKVVPAGSYTLVLGAKSADGQTDSTSAKLKLTRRRR
jgi:hypothetical protein